MQHQREFETFERVGLEPPRSYYVPFGREQEVSMLPCGIQDRSASNRFVSLNGEWAFGTYSRIEEAAIDAKLPDKIDVPSCVQMRGYDRIQYLNTRYPIPCDPPFVPKENPVFHYRKQITVEKGDFRWYLNFEGVDSFFYLFVNGTRLGYSQISHATSEFEVTDLFKEGENVIDVIVLKWCASTYLECQDKFRFSGIFRSVYLLKRPQKHIRDFKIETDAQKCLTVTNLSEIGFTATFEEETKNVAAGKSVTFAKADAELWTAVNRKLYGVVIEAEGEKILQRVGFRTSEVKNGVWLYNGKHLKLKGVNRHEFSPENGATVTSEEMLRDLKLMKEAHVNAIRTSHYPDVPEFYELCDVNGFYLVDEADVETHGMAVRDDGYLREPWQAFADSGIADKGVSDREITLYERDKNWTSVVIWSLGNEANWGKMFYEGADYIHAHDARPIHYENIFMLAERSDYYTKRIDIASRMYPPLEDFAAFLEDENETRPLMLCEYTHAMGNSNGDLNDYWKIIDSNDRFVGAFVWEWRDHAVKTEKGYLYGGDNGEELHDGNFCVDGLLNPDWTPKSGYYEMQAVYGGKRDGGIKLPVPEKLESMPAKNPVSYEIDENGALLSLGGKKFYEPLRVNIVRAYLDNDSFLRSEWSKLENAKQTAYAVETQGNVVKVTGKMLKDSFSPMLDFELTYEFFDGGADVELRYRAPSFLGFLPRVGLCFALAGEDEFSYCGYGPYESYVDKHLASEYGAYQTSAKKECFGYVKPQECGSHVASTRVELKRMTLTAERPFSFSVLPYSAEMLMNTKHSFELPESKAAYVSLDVAMSGVGSASCGPALAEKYRVPVTGSNKFRILLK